MAVAETVTSLEGLFKQQYPEGLPDLIPSAVKLQKLVDFVEKDLELGDSYVQPVRLSYPTGFTHAASGAGAFTLNASVAGQLRKATVDGSQILLRDQVDMESAAKASKGSKKAFDDIVSVTFDGLQKSMRKRLETQLFYGSNSIGQVSSISSGVITIVTSTWAPGIWSGIEGCNLDCYSAITSGTQRNTNAALVISTVSIDNKTVTVTGNGSDLSAIQANDFLFFYGAYGNEMKGLQYILSNTSATLFNVNAANYSLWQSASLALTGAASFNAIKKVVARGIGKGVDEDIDFMLNPSTWDDVMTDIAAMRRTDKSEVGKVVVGANEIEFQCQGIVVKLTPSIYMKEGLGFGVSKSYFKRVGAADITFNMPGFGDQIFFILPSNAGVESRCYTHQALFTDAPAKSLYVSGIVNNTSF